MIVLPVEKIWVDIPSLRKFLTESRGGKILNFALFNDGPRKIEAGFGLFTPPIENWLYEHTDPYATKLWFHDDLTTFTLGLEFSNPRLATMFKCRWAEGDETF